MCVVNRKVYTVSLFQSNMSDFYSANAVEPNTAKSREVGPGYLFVATNQVAIDLDEMLLRKKRELFLAEKSETLTRLIKADGAPFLKILPCKAHCTLFQAFLSSSKIWIEREVYRALQQETCSICTK